MSKNAALLKLSEEFWSWRSAQQPRSGDDIPRIERPADWIPRWAPEDIARYQEDLTGFEETLTKLFLFDDIDPNISPSDWVDLGLMHSALSRVRWELDYQKIWRRQPRFYVDQTIGTIFDCLTPQRIDSGTIINVRRLLQSFSKTLSDARKNLHSKAFQELAQESVNELSKVQEQLMAVGENLLSVVPIEDSDSFLREFKEAGAELAEFRTWLMEEIPNFPLFEPVGEDTFNWFLKNVAINPLTPPQLVDIGNLEFERAIFLETITKNRYCEIELPPLPASAQVQSENEGRLEAEVRAFYEAQNLLTQPSSLGR
jgi:hypothetical protein